jgi:hypothetical protein
LEAADVRGGAVVEGAVVLEDSDELGEEEWTRVTEMTTVEVEKRVEVVSSAARTLPNSGSSAARSGVARIFFGRRRNGAPLLEGVCWWKLGEALARRVWRVTVFFSLRVIAGVERDEYG